MASERALIDTLQRIFAKPSRDLLVGIGDDAAVVRNRFACSVLACDPVVAGVHFEAGTAPGLIGRKAVNRNLSDLAAMGARPDWLLVSALLPRGLKAPFTRALFGGMAKAAEAAGCMVVGGDVSSTPGPLSLSVCVVGHVRGQALQRSRGRLGDTLHVTGPLGGAALGHHLKFRPALEEGVWLTRQTGIGAVIDISDGLLLDLHRLLAASGLCGAELEAKHIPLRPAARRLARRTGRSPLAHALADGEDHVLLFTLRRGASLGRGGPLGECARRPIGRVCARRGLWLREASGELCELEPAGWQHEL